jgi:phosphoribosylanthranilate isomerase
MIRVKICGIRTEADAVMAAEAGADAIGMIFAPARRQIDAAQARRIAAALPPFVTKVGVFVNEPLDRVRALVDTIRLDAVQLHGDETPDDCATVREWGVTVIRAIQVAGPLDAAALRALPVHAVLLDTYRPGVRGGTGETFDWSHAVPVARCMPVILSGGLRPEFVAEGIKMVRPYGVDVSSGVETDGRKDPAKIQAFILAARSADLDAADRGPGADSPREQVRQ